MKLCKDCRHCRPHEIRVLLWVTKHYQYAKCAQTTDPVTGEAERFCEFERKPNRPCGPTGALWEALAL